MSLRIQHPRQSFTKAFEVANAVERLSGKCKVGTCADSLGLKPKTGYFSSILSASIIFGLVEKKNSELSITDLFKKCIYSENVLLYKRQSFLLPPLFNEVFEKFSGQILPEERLSKILILEYGLKKNAANYTAKYFNEGLRLVKLIDSNGEIIQLEDKDSTDTNIIQRSNDNSKIKVEKNNIAPVENSISNNSKSEPNTSYNIRIQGKNISMEVNIKSIEEFEKFTEFIRFSIEKEIGI